MKEFENEYDIWQRLLSFTRCIVCIRASPPPPQKYYPLFWLSPLLNLETVQAPLSTFLGNSPPYIVFFFGTLTTSPPLKIGFFNQPSIILRFFILNPSQLLKVTEFLVKISQFKLLAMFIKFFVTKYFRL